jgi:hypothetical protein
MLFLNIFLSGTRNTLDSIPLNNFRVQQFLKIWALSTLLFLSCSQCLFSLQKIHSFIPTWTLMAFAIFWSLLERRYCSCLICCTIQSDWYLWECAVRSKSYATHKEYDFSTRTTETALGWPIDMHQTQCILESNSLVIHVWMLISFLAEK